MIKATVNKFRVEVTGHADSAPMGQDIVCAAVSALVMATETAIPNHFKKSEIESKDEEGNIVFDGTGHYAIELMEPTGEANKILIIGMISVFITGLRLISENYPEHMTLEEITEDLQKIRAVK